MKNIVLRIHPKDNVLVALTDLKKGDEVHFENEVFVLVDDVKAKHKFGYEIMLNKLSEENQNLLGDMKLIYLTKREYKINSEVTVKFKNGKIWEIDLSGKNWEEFEPSLKDMLSTYESEIDNVDFKLDTERIKKDMIKNTNKFLKKRKLK